MSNSFITKPSGDIEYTPADLNDLTLTQYLRKSYAQFKVQNLLLVF